MKKVVLEFFGQKGDKAAEEFFTYLVDGGLEDQIIQFFEDRNIEIDMLESDSGQLKVLIAAKPL